jgi:hypothetical protein
MIGYFVGDITEKEIAEEIKERIGFKSMDVFDEEGKATGEKKNVPEYKKIIYRRLSRRFRTMSGKEHRKFMRMRSRIAICDGDMLDDGFLGKTIRGIAGRALKGNKLALVAIPKMLYATWMIKGEEEDIPHRGSMEEWLGLGKPKLETYWTPKVVLSGFPVHRISKEDGYAIAELIER